MVADQGRFRLAGDQGMLDIETRIHLFGRKYTTSFFTNQIDSNQGISISCIDPIHLAARRRKCSPQKTDPTLYGEEPFESCRQSELTATRLCAEDAEGQGAQVRGMGREIAQATMVMEPKERPVPLQPCAEAGRSDIPESRNLPLSRSSLHKV